MLDLKMKKRPFEEDESNDSFYEEPQWGIFKNEYRKEILV